MQDFGCTKIAKNVDVTMLGVAKYPAQANFERMGKEMSKMDAIVIEEYLNAREKWGGRIIGIKVSKVHTDYVEWMRERFEQTQRFQYKYPQIQGMFTRYVKEIRKIETTRKRVNGEQITVFWDSGATRLDLGHYLD